MQNESQTVEPYRIGPDAQRIRFPRRIDANAVADQLIAQFGMDLALKRATEGTFDALKDGDNYQLSVWREVKVILGKRGRDIAANAG